MSHFQTESVQHWFRLVTVHFLDQQLFIHSIFYRADTATNTDVENDPMPAWVLLISVKAVSGYR